VLLVAAAAVLAAARAAAPAAEPSEGSALVVAPPRLLNDVKFPDAAGVLAARLRERLAGRFEVASPRRLGELLAAGGLSAEALEALAAGSVPAGGAAPARLGGVRYVLAGAAWGAPSGGLWFTARLWDRRAGRLAAATQVRAGDWEGLLERLDAAASALAAAAGGDAPAALPALAGDERTLELRVEQIEAIGDELDHLRYEALAEAPWGRLLRETFDGLAPRLVADIETKIQELLALDAMTANADVESPADTEDGRELASMLLDEHRSKDPKRRDLAREVAHLRGHMRSGHLGNLCLPKRLTLKLPNDVPLTLALVPVGLFAMGSPAEEAGRGADEGPLRRLRADVAFYISTTEVTQEQYEAVTGHNPSRFRDGRLPVEQVNWEEAVEFCELAGEKLGKLVRLPTEAEWECAARAGTRTPFSTGETISPQQASYDGTYAYGAGPKGAYRLGPVPAGHLPPNAWGLHEMHGNVWEWCADAYAAYPGGVTCGPTQWERGPYRVVRGGCWRSYPWHCRSAVRMGCDPRLRDRTVGFRVICEPDVVPPPRLDKTGARR